MHRGEVKKKAIEIFIAALASVVLTAVLNSILSYIKYRDWYQWMRTMDGVPIIQLVIIALIFSVFVDAVRRYRKKHTYRTPLVFSYSTSMVECGILTYLGVSWKEYGEYDQWGHDDIPYEVEIRGAPMCPKCKTELKEMKNFFSGYTWFCIRCDFRTKMKASFYEARQDATLIIKGINREQREKAPKNVF